MDEQLESIIQQELIESNSHRYQKLLDQVDKNASQADQQKEWLELRLNSDLTHLATILRTEKSVFRDPKALIPKTGSILNEEPVQSNLNEEKIPELNPSHLYPSEIATSLSDILQSATILAEHMGRTPERVQVLGDVMATICALEAVGSIGLDPARAAIAYEGARQAIIEAIRAINHYIDPLFDHQKDDLIPGKEAEFAQIRNVKVANITYLESGKYLSKIFGGSADERQVEITELISHTSFADFLIIVCEKMGLPFDETQSIEPYLNALAPLVNSDEFAQNSFNTLKSKGLTSKLNSEQRKKIQALKGLNRATWMWLNFERADEKPGFDEKRLDPDQREGVYNPQSILEAKMYNAYLDLTSSQVAAIARVAFEMWKDFGEPLKVVSALKENPMVAVNVAATLKKESDSLPIQSPG